MRVSTTLWACVICTALSTGMTSKVSQAMVMDAFQQNSTISTNIINIATQAEINAAKAEWKRLADEKYRLRHSGANYKVINEAIRKRNEAHARWKQLEAELANGNSGASTQSQPAQQQQAAPQQQQQQQNNAAQNTQQTTSTPEPTRTTVNTTSNTVSNMSAAQAKAEWKRLADEKYRLRHSGANYKVINEAIRKRDEAYALWKQIESGQVTGNAPAQNTPTSQASSSAQQQNDNFSNDMGNLVDRVTGQDNNTPTPAPQPSPVFNNGGNLNTPCSKYALAWRDQYGTFGDWNANVPTNLLSYGKAPDGSNAIVHQIRAGQIQHGDFKTRHLNGARAACLTYKMWLPGNFTNVGPSGWHVSKLPGLYGGQGNNAQGCKSPSEQAATGTWSARLMFAHSGVKPYAYIYSLNRNGGTVGQYRGGRICGDSSTYSSSNPNFPRNRWVQIDEEVIMNTPGQGNGLVRLWFDGRLLGTVSGAELVARGKNTGVDGIFFNVWFGGPAGDPRNKAQGNYTWYYKDFAIFAQ